MLPLTRRWFFACFALLASTIILIAVFAIRERHQAQLDRSLYNAVVQNTTTTARAENIIPVYRLLAQGADPNAFIWDGPPPPPWYAPLIDILHFHRPRHHAATPHREYALSTAAYADDYPAVKALVDAGADVRDDRDGRTPLMEAADASDGPMTALLLAHGADVWAETGGGFSWSALNFGINRRWHDWNSPPPAAVRLLLAHGADPNQGTGSRNRSSPFLMAAEGYEWPTVFLMIQHGANVNARAGDDVSFDTAGMTAMDYALNYADEYGDFSIAHRLVKAGAVPSQTFCYDCYKHLALPAWYKRLLHPVEHSGKSVNAHSEPAFPAYSMKAAQETDREQALDVPRAEVA